MSLKKISYDTFSYLLENELGFLKRFLEVNLRITLCRRWIKNHHIEFYAYQVNNPQVEFTAVEVFNKINEEVGYDTAQKLYVHYMDMTR